MQEMAAEEEMAAEADGHHNLNCAKLKQAKLKLKLNTQIVAVARPLDF